MRTPHRPTTSRAADAGLPSITRHHGRVGTDVAPVVRAGGLRSRHDASHDVHPGTHAPAPAAVRSDRCRSRAAAMALLPARPGPTPSATAAAGHHRRTAHLGLCGSSGSTMPASAASKGPLGRRWLCSARAVRRRAAWPGCATRGRRCAADGRPRSQALPVHEVVNRVETLQQTRASALRRGGGGASAGGQPMPAVKRRPSRPSPSAGSARWAWAPGPVPGHGGRGAVCRGSVPGPGFALAGRRGPACDPRPFGPWPSRGRAASAVPASAEPAAARRRRPRVLVGAANGRIERGAPVSTAVCCSARRLDARPRRLAPRRAPASVTRRPPGPSHHRGTQTIASLLLRGAGTGIRLAGAPAPPMVSGCRRAHRGNLWPGGAPAAAPAVSSAAMPGCSHLARESSTGVASSGSGSARHRPGSSLARPLHPPWHPPWHPTWHLTGLAPDGACVGSLTLELACLVCGIAPGRRARSSGCWAMCHGRAAPARPRPPARPLPPAVQASTAGRVAAGARASRPRWTRRVAALGIDAFSSPPAGVEAPGPRPQVPQHLLGRDRSSGSRQPEGGDPRSRSAEVSGEWRTVEAAPRGCGRRHGADGVVVG